MDDDTNGDLPQAAVPVCPDCRVECSRGDPLVLGEEVVRQFVKERDAADDRGTGHELVAIVQELLEQREFLGVSVDTMIPRARVMRPLDRTVLRVVIEPTTFMAFASNSWTR